MQVSSLGSFDPVAFVTRNRSIYRSAGGGNEEIAEAQRTIGLVWDGTPCGENLICLNQTCSSIFPYIDQTKCPTNNNNLECSGHGVSVKAQNARRSFIEIPPLLLQFCTNLNKCHCELGWGGPDCSLQVEVALLPMSTRPPDTTPIDLTKSMQKKETPYGRYAFWRMRPPRPIDRERSVRHASGGGGAFDATRNKRTTSNVVALRPDRESLLF